MTHARRLVLILGLLVQGCVAVNSREACQVTQLAEIPLQIVDNQPIVDVTIGDRPARMLLDTGATHTVFTDAAFARLGLNYDQNITVTSTGAAGQSVSRMSQPVRLMLGGLLLPAKPVVSVQSATALAERRGIDGLLGVDLLSGFDVDLDMPRRKLGLYAARQCPDGPSPFAGPAFTYKTPPNPRQYLYVPALADGHALSLIVDTGANRTYLDRRHLGLPGASVGDEPLMQIGSSGPGSIAAPIHLFRAVTIGDTTFHNVRLVTGSVPFQLDGLLGTDFWRLRRLWLSFAGWATTIQGHNPN